MTGGPGGTSTTLMEVPSGTASAFNFSRSSSAMTWLARERSPRAVRLTCSSPSSGAARR